MPRGSSGDAPPITEGTPIPIITFLRDLVALTRGPYHRLVERNTRDFCARADKLAVTEKHRMAMLIVAAGADEFLAGLLGLTGGKNEAASKDGTSSSTGFARSRPQVPKKVTCRQAAQAMRSYASMVLVMLGKDKGRMLQAAGLAEEEWMKRWRQAFGYRPEDMRLFNEAFVPACRQSGLDGLTAAVAKSVGEALSSGNGDEIHPDAELLKGMALHDLSVILKRIGEEPCHALCHRQ